MVPLKSRLASLDGLRGIAALAVLAFHYGERLGIDSMHYGLLGVDLFFIISGFVIFLTLARRPDLAQFIRSRVARLYPAYIVSVVFAVAVYLPMGKATIPQSLANLTMLQRFIGIPDIITAYWTLAFELWFYFLIALSFSTGAIKRIELLCLTWLIGVGGLRLAEAQLFGGHIPGLGKSIGQSLTLLTMVHYGHLFIIGMMLFRLHNGGGRLAIFTLIVALAYSMFGRRDWSDVSALVYFPVVCSFSALVWDATGSNRLGAFLSGRAMLFLGSISYSLYLMHELVVAVAVLVMPSVALAVGIAMPVSILFAWGVRRFVEVPWQELLDPRHNRHGIAPIPQLQ